MVPRSLTSSFLDVSSHMIMETAALNKELVSPPPPSQVSPNAEALADRFLWCGACHTEQLLWKFMISKGWPVCTIDQAMLLVKESDKGRGKISPRLSGGLASNDGTQFLVKYEYEMFYSSLYCQDFAIDGYKWVPQEHFGPAWHKLRQAVANRTAQDGIGWSLEMWRSLLRRGKLRKLLGSTAFPRGWILPGMREPECLRV